MNTIFRINKDRLITELNVWNDGDWLFQTFPFFNIGGYSHNKKSIYICTGWLFWDFYLWFCWGKIYKPEPTVNPYI